MHEMHELKYTTITDRSDGLNLDDNGIVPVHSSTTRASCRVDFAQGSANSVYPDRYLPGT